MPFAGQRSHPIPDRTTKRFKHYCLRNEDSQICKILDICLDLDESTVLDELAIFATNVLEGAITEQVNCEGAMWLLDKTGHLVLRPLHAAAYRGHAKVVEWLLTRNADINAQIKKPDKKGDKIMSDTPLHIAVWYNHIQVVQCLLLDWSPGADLSIGQEQDFTVLHHAARHARSECVDAILKHATRCGATAALRGALYTDKVGVSRHPLRLSCESHSLRCFRAMLEHELVPSPRGEHEKQFEKLRDTTFFLWENCHKMAGYILSRLCESDKAWNLFQDKEVPALAAVIEQVGPEWAKALDGIVYEPDQIFHAQEGVIKELARHRAKEENGDVSHAFANMKMFWFQNFVNRWKGWATLSDNVRVKSHTQAVLHVKDGKTDYPQSKEKLVVALREGRWPGLCTALGICQEAPAKLYVIPVDVKKLTHTRIIKALACTKNEDMIATTAAEMILQSAWSEIQIGYFIHLCLAVAHVILILCSTPSLGESPPHWGLILLQALLIGKKLFEEACQFAQALHRSFCATNPKMSASLTFIEYAVSIRTWSDWTSLFLCVAGLVCLADFSEEPLARSLTGLYFLIIWLGGLYSMRGISLWGFNARLLPILRAMQKTTTFFFVLGVSLVATSHCYYVIGQMYNLTSYPAYLSFQRTFRLGFLGDFDLEYELVQEDPSFIEVRTGQIIQEDPAVKPEHFPVHVLFYIAAFGLTIVQMNLFIGILSNNFDHFVDQSKGLVTREQAHLVLYFRSLPWNYLGKCLGAAFQWLRAACKWLRAACSRCASRIHQQDGRVSTILEQSIQEQQAQEICWAFAAVRQYTDGGLGQSEPGPKAEAGVQDMQPCHDRQRRCEGHLVSLHFQEAQSRQMEVPLSPKKDCQG